MMNISEMCNYNPNLVWIHKIPKRFRSSKSMMKIMMKNDVNHTFSIFLNIFFFFLIFLEYIAIVKSFIDVSSMLIKYL